MLTGKTALVTGSSSGIGRAIAEEFGRAGANVVVNYYSNASGAEETVETITEAGQQAVAIQADVSSTADVEALVEQTYEEFDEIDILVNNAGIFPRYSWEDMERSDWERVLHTNLGGLFEISKRIVPRMADRDETGAVINISSTWALQGGMDTAAYTASKGGIVSLTRQMCKQFAADGVRVNTVTPGAVRTAMNEALREDDEYVQSVRESVPAGRFGRPSDIADVVTFLASPRAAYIHGQNIVVDGGLTA